MNKEWSLSVVIVFSGDYWKICGARLWLGNTECREAPRNGEPTSKHRAIARRNDSLGKGYQIFDGLSSCKKNSFVRE